MVISQFVNQYGNRKVFEKHNQTMHKDCSPYFPKENEITQKTSRKNQPH